jgi:hypothetical protein
MTASDGWVHDRFGTAWMLKFRGTHRSYLHPLALAALRWINPPKRARAWRSSSLISQSLIAFLPRT